MSEAVTWQCHPPTQQPAPTTRTAPHQTAPGSRPWLRSAARRCVCMGGHMGGPSPQCLVWSHPGCDGGRGRLCLWGWLCLWSGEAQAAAVEWWRASGRATCSLANCLLGGSCGGWAGWRWSTPSGGRLLVSGERGCCHGLWLIGEGPPFCLTRLPDQAAVTSGAATACSATGPAACNRAAGRRRRTAEAVGASGLASADGGVSAGWGVASFVTDPFLGMGCEFCDRPFSQGGGARMVM